MPLIPREVSILFGKEWRQLLRSGSALATSFLMPLLMLVVVPLILVTAGRAAGGGPSPKLGLPSFLPGLAELESDPVHGLPRFLLPFLVGMTGLIVPSVAGAHTLVYEREARTIELLVALPVRIGQVLLAKLGAIVLLAGAVTVPLLLLNIAAMVGAGVFGWGYGVALVVELLGALGYSTASALLVSLLAGDYRAAQNVLGVLLGPSILLIALSVVFLPGGPVKIAGMGVLFALLGALLGAIAVRVVTFERLLR